MKSIKICLYLMFSLPYGFVVKPDASLEVVKELDINIKPYSDVSERTVKAVFSAGNIKIIYLNKV